MHTPDLDVLLTVIESVQPVGWNRPTQHQMVHQAERSRAQIFEVPGKVAPTEFSRFQHDLGKLLSSRELIHSVMVEEDYLVVGTHVDDQTKHKIILGEYVNFSRLIPKIKSFQRKTTRWR